MITLLLAYSIACLHNDRPPHPQDTQLQHPDLHFHLPTFYEGPIAGKVKHNENSNQTACTIHI